MPGAYLLLFKQNLVMCKLSYLICLPIWMKEIGFIFKKKNQQPYILFFFSYQLFTAVISMGPLPWNAVTNKPCQWHPVRVSCWDLHGEQSAGSMWPGTECSFSTKQTSRYLRLGECVFSHRWSRWERRWHFTPRKAKIGSDERTLEQCFSFCY